MKLSDLGENGLLALIRDWTRSASPSLLLGPGDDAALLAPTGAREIVVSTDAWVDDVHFSRAILQPDEIGHRIMAGSLSDLAAMGAEGLAAFVNVHAPGDLTVDFLRRVYLGLDRVADACGVVLAGGDTVRGPLAFDLTVIGTVAPGTAFRRDGARPGDVVCVSGELGAAEAGRRLLAKETREEMPAGLRAEAEAAHRTPKPRFDVVRLLRSLERREVDAELTQETVTPLTVTAAMDVSDGLALDLTRLCEASRTGVRVFERRIPLSLAARRLARLEDRSTLAAASGGEDFEILFTIAPEDEGVLVEAAERASLTVTPFAVMTDAEDGLLLVHDDDTETPLEPSGWDHFRGEGAS